MAAILFPPPLIMGMSLITVEPAVSAGLLRCRRQARHYRESSGGLPAFAQTELRRGRRLLFLTEFLKSGIVAQRVPDWIEPEKSWRNGHYTGNPAIIRSL